jgi:TPR repeat protein
MCIDSWYQRAADQGNAEGLYNVGVYNLHGLAGFARNEEVAIQYFHRAANGSNPFPMAVHALGKQFRYVTLKLLDHVGVMAISHVIYLQAIITRTTTIILPLACTTNGRLSWDHLRDTSATQ